MIVKFSILLRLLQDWASIFLLKMSSLAAKASGSYDRIDEVDKHKKKRE